MKTFVVNQDSWHYRLNVRMLKTNTVIDTDKEAELYLKSRNNLCLYWQTTIWSIVKILLLVSLSSFLLFLLGLILYVTGIELLVNPFFTLITILGALTIVGLTIFFAWVYIVLEKRKEDRITAILYKRDQSLAKAKYDSWKSGICLPIEFREGDKK